MNMKGKEVKSYYHDDGTTAIQFELVDGKKHGFYREFDKDGYLIYHVRYENGELVETLLKNNCEDVFCSEMIEDGTVRKLYSREGRESTLMLEHAEDGDSRDKILTIHSVDGEDSSTSSIHLTVQEAMCIAEDLMRFAKTGSMIKLEEGK